MFRYSKLCPDCKGVGWHPCEGCKDSQGLPCLGWKNSCPFPGFSEDGQIHCSRCEHYGVLAVTELEDDAGNIVLHEEPHTLRTAVPAIYSAVDDIFEAMEYIRVLDSTAPEYDLIFGEELKEDVASGKITDETLVYCIPRENDDFLYGIRAKESGQFLLIQGEYGCYLPSDEGFVRIEYDDLEEIIEEHDKLKIVYAISEDKEETQTIVIKRTPENGRYLRELRLAFNQIIRKERNWGYSHQHTTVYLVLERYIGKLSKYGKEYEFESGSHWSHRKNQAERRLHQVLFSYGAKIRRPHAVALIDTTAEGMDDRGILFAQDGLAFCNGKNYGYIPYEDIRYMTTNKAKTTVTLHGYFNECLHTCKRVSFSKAEYNIDVLEACFKFLLRHV